jgi:hypothetical protein
MPFGALLLASPRTGTSTIVLVSTVWSNSCTVADHVPIKTLEQEALSQFIGTENWYQHGLVRSVTYTDGAKYVADNGGAYWLLDEIALAQNLSATVNMEPFQVWKLTVSDHKGFLTYDDGNDKIVYIKEISFTDFPLSEIRFYFTDNVILLPSEY